MRTCSGTASVIIRNTDWKDPKTARRSQMQRLAEGTLEFGAHLEDELRSPTDHSVP